MQRWFEWQSIDRYIDTNWIKIIDGKIYRFFANRTAYGFLVLWKWMQWKKKLICVIHWHIFFKARNLKLIILNWKFFNEENGPTELKSKNVLSNVEIVYYLLLFSYWSRKCSNSKNSTPPQPLNFSKLIIITVSCVKKRWKFMQCD